MSITESKTVIRISCSSKTTISHVENAARSRVSSALLQVIFMSDPGDGKGHRYAHDEPGGYAAGERCFPDDMPDRRYYVPAPRGLEIKIGEALEARRARDRDAKDSRGVKDAKDTHGAKRS